MNKIPREVWIQWKDDDEWLVGEVTWCAEKIHKHDLRYILDKRHVKKLPKIEAELTGGG